MKVFNSGVLFFCVIFMLVYQSMAQEVDKPSIPSVDPSYSNYYNDYWYWPTYPNTPRRVRGELCNRACNGVNLICEFYFNVEIFYSMSKACYGCPNPISDCFREDCIVAGGVRRTVMVANRKLPGPPIEVCKDDLVIVHVINQLKDGEETTIHWHGLHMKKQQYMDGVPWVTQCPIHYNNNFTYEFNVSDPGTYWWHSHVEMQRGDGLFGKLIVRSQRDPQRHLYDIDISAHVIMAGDWNDRLRLDVFQEYALAGGSMEPTGILINGLGFQNGNNITRTPLANFIVEPGKRHRFRFINVEFFDCPLEFSIEGHKMTIIATDARDVEPMEVDSFASSSGERFDFIVYANQAPRTYYIKVKGFLICQNLGTFTLATLQYNGTRFALPATTPTYQTPSLRGTTLLNPINIIGATENRNFKTIADLVTKVPVKPNEINSRNVFKRYITVDMSAVDHPVTHRYPYYSFNNVSQEFRVRTPQFNRISHKNFDRPFLQDRYTINSNEFCDERKLAQRRVNCMTTFCECPHVIEVPLGVVVELVLIDLADQSDAIALHPIHLHGFSFRVVAWREMNRNFTLNDIINDDAMGRIQRNLVNPPLKDTVSVPRRGYTIIRFYTDNAGYWIMHCHIDVHSSEGMDIIFKAGRNEDMPNAPAGFPTCHNYPKKF